MRILIMIIILIILWAFDRHLSELSEGIRVEEPYTVEGDSTCYCKICTNRFIIH